MCLKDSLVHIFKLTFPRINLNLLTKNIYYFIHLKTIKLEISILFFKSSIIRLQLIN